MRFSVKPPPQILELNYYWCDSASSDIGAFCPKRLKTTYQIGEEIMKTRAAIAFEAGKPLEIMDVDLEGPKAGEANH